MLGHIECVTFQPRPGVDMSGWSKAIEELAAAHGCVLLEGAYDRYIRRGYFVYAYRHSEEGSPGPLVRHWKPPGMYLSIQPVPVLLPAQSLLSKLVNEEIPADSDFIK
ncbi:MAG: hypothetical protein ACO1SV_12180 [Fimbriimonas sp.]